MRGTDRTEYLADICTSEPLFEGDWQVIVDTETGIAFTLHLMAVPGLPRIAVADLLDEGFIP